MCRNQAGMRVIFIDTLRCAPHFEPGACPALVSPGRA